MPRQRSDQWPSSSGSFDALCLGPELTLRGLEVLASLEKNSWTLGACIQVLQDPCQNP